MSGFVNNRADGAEIHWVNDTGESRAADDLVAIGSLVGLVVVRAADRMLEPGAEGDVRLEGIASVPKTFGAIARGTEVDFDAGTRVAKVGTKLGKGDVAGFAVAVADAAADDREVVVKFTPGRGRVK